MEAAIQCFARMCYGRHWATILMQVSLKPRTLSERTTVPNHEGDAEGLHMRFNQRLCPISALEETPPCVML